MAELSRNEYRDFHVSCGSAGKNDVLQQRTDRAIGTLTDYERRQELYGLYKNAATPGIMRALDDIRSRYELGLARRSNDGTVVSAVDETFVEETSENDDMPVVNAVYRAMRRSLELSADMWKNDMLAANDADFHRMEELIDPATRAKYGAFPVAKRVASATAQSVAVGLGMQELGKRLYRKKFGVEATASHVVAFHRSSLRTALQWADFNQSQLIALEGKIRTLRTDHDGIEPLHAENAFDVDEIGNIIFTGRAEMQAVLDGKPNVGSGRFGCPGKWFFPHLWKWTEEVSEAYGLAKKRMST